MAQDISRVASTRQIPAFGLNMAELLTFDASQSGTFVVLFCLLPDHARVSSCSALVVLPCVVAGIVLEDVAIASASGAKHPVAFQCTNAFGTARNVTPRSCLQ